MRFLWIPLLLSACSGRAGLETYPVPNAPMPIGSAGLSGLVGGSSGTDAGLVDLLNRQPGVTFPVRLGVLFLNYSDPLKPEDQQTLMDGITKDVVAAGQVRSVVQIPATLVNATDSVDTLRSLAARFQVDLLLLVSGSNDTAAAPDQPAQGLFGGAGTSYESRTTLSGLALGVYSGTFLTPFEVTGKSGPTTVDPSGSAGQAQLYQLALAAQTQALGNLKSQLIEGLKQLQAYEATLPSPTPTPVPTAAPSASPTPSPSPSV